MARAYNVIDSDGHILEPLTLWNDYMDPAFRDRAPKLVIDKDGKERLLVEEQVLGSQQGMGGIGGVGARQGVVPAETMSYEEGRPGGFDPHKRIPDMDLDGIDAAFLYPSMGLFAGAVHDPELVPSRFVLEFDWRGLRLDEDRWSGCKVNRLIGEFLGQALPSIDFAHGDLT